MSEMERIREEVAQSTRLFALIDELRAAGLTHRAEALDAAWCSGDYEAARLIEVYEPFLKPTEPAPVVEKPRPPEPEPDPGPGEPAPGPEPVGGWTAADFDLDQPDPEADTEEEGEGVVTVVDHRQPKAEPAEATKERRTADPEEQEQRIVSWLFGILDDISPRLPPLVFLGYLHCWRLADWQTGEFYVSHERIAERLGVKSRHTAKKVMRTLAAARLVRIKVKGKEGQATLYRLAPRSAFNRDRIIAAVVSTWMNLNPKMLEQATGHQRAGRRVTREPVDGSPQHPYPLGRRVTRSPTLPLKDRSPTAGRTATKRRQSYRR